MQKGGKRNVYKVYDKIAAWFSENRYCGLMEKGYLDDLISRIPPKGTVLDLGCGTGRPILEYLVGKGLQVTGVDASSSMLDIARANFPDTEFILQDMRVLNLNRKFDAIVAWHSFFHLPAADQPDMFKCFGAHIEPGGILLFTSGTEHGEAWGMNGGEYLFHASLDPEEYHRLLKKSGFSVLKHVVKDANCGHATVWFCVKSGTFSPKC